MTAQQLDRVITTYRIGDPNGTHPIYDAIGSTLAPGRWNTPTSPMIYTARTYSTAVLEKLVHAGGGGMPPHQHYIVITISAGLSYEGFDEHAYPGWDAIPATVSKQFGEAWQLSKRSLLLIVPSVVARLDDNVLINPYHPDFHKIQHTLHNPVHWDARLFIPTP